MRLSPSTCLRSPVDVDCVVSQRQRFDDNRVAKCRLRGCYFAAGCHLDVNRAYNCTVVALYDLVLLRLVYG